MGGRGGGKVKDAGDMIPMSAKETIKTVWENTGKKHSDEEIYSLLKDCDMDSNQATQKLQYLDTFQEVKRKPKKEAPQQRGSRAARGNYYSNNYKSDVGRERNASSRRENDKSNAVSHIATAASNGTASLSNGSSSLEHLSKVSADNNKGAKEALSDQKKESSEAPAETTKGAWASLFTAQVKPLPSSNRSLTTTAARLPSSKRALAPTTAPLPSSNRSSAPLPSSNRSSAPLPSSNRSSTPTTASVSGTPSSAADPVSSVGTIKSKLNHIKGSKAISNAPNSVPSVKAPSRPMTSEQNGPSAVPPKPSPSEANTSKVSTASVKDDSKVLPRSSAPEGRYVTFPAHFPVSGALKFGFTFGSFGSTSELGTSHTETTPTDAIESSQGSDVTAEESSTKQGDTSEQPPIPPVFEQVPESETNIPSNEEIKLQVETSPSLTVENGPSYNLGFMEPQSTSQYVTLDAPEPQPRGVSSFSDFMNDNSSAPSSSTPTSVGAPPQFPRQPLPPNYYPYGHYPMSPYMMPPVHPQFYSANGLPQQPLTGNVYHSSGALPSAVKLPHHAVFRPGTGAGTAAHMTLPSGYGSFNTLPFGLNHVPAPTSSKEDLVDSQLKENHSYMTGSASEGSGPWSSMYNHLPFHGQHLAYSPAQAGHGPFTGLYQAPPTMEAPSETPGHPNGYQQPQGAQLNWNANY